MNMGLEQSCSRYVGIEQISVEYCVLNSKIGMVESQASVPSPIGCETGPLHEDTGQDNVYTVATR